jgi:hypothetical protein
MARRRKRRRESRWPPNSWFYPCYLAALAKSLVVSLAGLRSAFLEFVWGLGWANGVFGLCVETQCSAMECIIPWRGNGNKVESACILWIDIDAGDVEPAVKKSENGPPYMSTSVYKDKPAPLIHAACRGSGCLLTPHACLPTTPARMMSNVPQTPYRMPDHAPSLPNSFVHSSFFTRST